jgi:hypothetical protein
MTNDNFCFYLQNRLIQTSQTGGQQYSDTSPFSIPCIMAKNRRHWVSWYTNNGNLNTMTLEICPHENAERITTETHRSRFLK